MSKYELKNPNAPMSYKQGIMIRNLGGGDVREKGLNMQQASDRIGELMAAKRGNGSKSNDLSPDTILKMDRDQQFQKIWDAAVAAGIKAGKDAIPAPMIVTEHESALDDSSPARNQWYVAEGACGFAWVQIKPGTSTFAKWLKKMDYAHRDSYYGGVSIWIADHGQSMARKEAHASAMARVFKEAGFNSHSMSRMD